MAASMIVCHGQPFTSTPRKTPCQRRGSPSTRTGMCAVHVICAWLQLVSCVAADFVKLGDGQCNGGVGGIGEYRCLLGGACNQGGTPFADPTSVGTGCPGNEYLACDESENVTEATCRAACATDVTCVGFMISQSQTGGGKCELHSRAVEFASLPLECYSYAAPSFALLGYGACRSENLMQTGPRPNTYYGNYNITWEQTLAACQDACVAVPSTCVGVEFAQTARDDGLHKCETHFAALSQQRMVVFACWVPNAHVGFNSAAPKASIFGVAALLLHGLVA